MNLSKLRKMAVDGDMSVQALRYLLDCRGECEHLDFKEELHLDSDYGCATLGRDVIGIKNAGGGYLVLGVEDKTWEPKGLRQPFLRDTKQLRDLVRKATGLELQVDVVTHSIFVSDDYREFTLILIRSTAKRNKRRTPSVCKVSFRPKEEWGIRSGDIYIRNGDQTVRIASAEELDSLLADLQEREDRLELEKEFSEPSPFWVETGLYRLLPREYDTFVGRSDLREQAMKAIEGDPRIWIIDLYGPGGVGKSALANWLTYHYHEQNFFEAILQLSAKDTQLSASGMTRLHPTLYSLENLLDSILLLFGHGEYSEQPLDKRSSVVTELLSAFSLLLVLDNMETVRDGRVLEFVRSLPPDTKTKVLMTTRSRTQSWEMPIAVTELNSDEVKEFLRIRSGIMNINLGKNFDDTADCIHKASGGLPLAIQWILGQYNLTGDISSVVAQVRGRESPLLEFSFRNSWILLPEEAQVALAILSIFDEAPTIHIWSTALGWSAEDVERAAYKLAEATFVTKIVDPKTGQETFHALPITLSFAGNELAKMGNLELTARTRYQRHVQEMELVAAETERYTDLFDRFAVERETEKQAVILARKAEPHVGSFNYDEAERLYKMAEEIDPRSVFVLVNYGLLKLSMGHVGEAIRLAERATAYVTRKTGFWVYYNLSQIYAAEKNRDKVEYCLRKALEYSPKHTIARHQLGVAVSKLGKYDEADRIFDELIADELARPSGPSDSLVIAYKTKLISMVKAGRKVEASQVLDMAIRETARWPYLANKAQELTDIF